MRTQKILFGISLLNLVLLLFVLSERHSVSAQGGGPVLRGRALEIVDARDRVRASITVEPPVTIDGRTYPETVLLRMSDPNVRPIVKLVATEQGSGLMLSNDSVGGVQIGAQDTGSFVKVTNHSPGKSDIIGRDGR